MENNFAATFRRITSTARSSFKILLAACQPWPRGQLAPFLLARRLRKPLPTIYTTHVVRARGEARTPARGGAAALAAQPPLQAGRGPLDAAGAGARAGAAPLAAAAARDGGVRLRHAAGRAWR
eukprot:3587808-Prymnesium_polylepis.1